MPNKTDIDEICIPNIQAQACLDAPLSIGTPAVNFKNIETALEEFYQVYLRSPKIVNSGGMKSAHLFLMWYSLKSLAPKTIIESGIYKGLGTWWLEQACPTATIFCIDVDFSNIEYKSTTATYLDRDFSLHTWEGIDKSSTLIFFDDHQNALMRLMQLKWMGFSHAIFEDNYPALQGDCYSCKKILSQAGVCDTTKNVPPPNATDKYYLLKNVATYQEFPPVFKAAQTRWHDAWQEPFYKTPSPLLIHPNTDAQQLLFEEADAYTWMCYIALKE